MYKQLGKGIECSAPLLLHRGDWLGKRTAQSKLVRIAVITLIAALISFPVAFSYTAVHADAPLPDSIGIEVIYVNRNLIENGDFLLMAQYDIAYTTIPDDAVDKVFAFRLIDTVGVTELGSSLAYPYYNSGYGQGLVSFYFEASDAPTWGQEYTLRISGNPTQFASPPVENFILTSSDYTSLTGQEDNQDEVASRVLQIADDLQVAWSVDLLDETDTGTVLSSYGEAYFRHAIFGLQVMAPSVFYVQVADPDYDERTWGTNQASAYESRFTGTWVGDTVSSFGNLFGIDSHMVSGAFILLACVALVAVSRLRFQSTYPGFIGACAITLAGAVMGWIPMAILAIIGLLFTLYIGYFWFFQRA